MMEVSTLVAMAVPFVIGLLAGYLVKKVLKIAVILVIVAVAASCLGLFNLNLSFDRLKSAAGFGLPFLVSLLPLGAGFFAGLVLGVLLG